MRAKTARVSKVVNINLINVVRVSYQLTQHLIVALIVLAYLLGNKSREVSVMTEIQRQVTIYELSTVHVLEA